MGRVQFVVIRKIYECLFIPDCMRKIIDYLLTILIKKMHDTFKITLIEKQHV